MFVVQKLAQDSEAGINMFHMIFIRQSMLLLISYGHVKSEGHDLSRMGYHSYCKYSADTRRLVALRNLFDWTAGILLAFSIQLMPVSQSVSLSRLLVFFTPLLAYFLINEKISVPEILTIAGGFTGVLLIMNPSWFNTDQL